MALKLSQNIAKSMAYIINQSCGDFSAKADLSTFGSGVLTIS